MSWTRFIRRGTGPGGLLDKTKKPRRPKTHKQPGKNGEASQREALRKARNGGYPVRGAVQEKSLGGACTMKKEIMQSISSLVAEYNHLEGSHRGTDAQNVLRRIFDTAAALEKERDALKQRLAVEVEKAFIEGWECCARAQKRRFSGKLDDWNNSRAKRVSEGKE